MEVDTVSVIALALDFSCHDFVGFAMTTDEMQAEVTAVDAVASNVPWMILDLSPCILGVVVASGPLLHDHSFCLVCC